jgi:hypothetical protein
MVNWQFYDEDKRSKPPPVYTHPKTSPSRKFFNWQGFIFFLVITMSYGVRFYNNGKDNTVKPPQKTGTLIDKLTGPTKNPINFNPTDNVFIIKGGTSRPNIGIKTEGIGNLNIMPNKSTSDFSLSNLNLNATYRDPDQTKFSNIQDIEIVPNTHFGENNGLYLGEKPPPLYKK